MAVASWNETKLVQEEHRRCRGEPPAEKWGYWVGEDNMALAQLLLSHGANVNVAASFTRTTALLEASRCGDADVVQLLLDHGADVNAKDRNGDTALVTAAKAQSMECMEELVRFGADVNAKDKDGCTPLNRELVRIAEKLLADDDRGAQELEWRGVELAKMLFAVGAHVNVAPEAYTMAIGYYFCRAELPELLYAAGEEIYNEAVCDDYFVRPDNEEWSGRLVDLMRLCRRCIRRYMMAVDRHTNLFYRLHQLQKTKTGPVLPAKLVSFLLFDQTLEIRKAT